MSRIIRYLHRAALLQDGGGKTDGQLLECFIAEKDEAAFEALVRRHGPMVLGVCRRLLRNSHDAEDAFQVTFLILVHNAATIVPRENVAKWLYGVAYRTAQKARGQSAKRWAKEKQVRVLPEAVAADKKCWRDLEPLLDQELNRLPNKYRVPIILCELEGRTHKEAARQLGWPPGTLSVRLARAKALLAKRLSRRGLALSAGAAALAQNGASASVPSALVASTVKAATLYVARQVSAGVVSAKITALMKGVLISMFLTKVKNLTVIVLLVSFVTASAIVSGHVLRAEPDATKRGTAPATQEKDKPKKGDKAAPKPEGADAKVRELLKKRLTTLKELVRIKYNMALGLLGIRARPLAELMQANTHLVQAELELCESDQQRLAVHGRALVFAKELETTTEKWFKNTELAQDEFLTVVAYQLEAEIAYERAKAKVAP
jgi:RNA polymerase sigma factor (sigma-70 family)